MFTFFLCCCVCAVSVLSALHTDRSSLSSLTPADVPVVWGCPLRCVRALNFVHCVRCVKFIYTRRLRTLRALLQKAPYFVAVVEFCVYLIHLSFWYCKSRQRSFVRFLVFCISWSRFVFHCTVVLAVWWYWDGRPNRELWPRLVAVQWSEFWHVNSFQPLCWEIGDKSRSWKLIKDIYIMPYSLIT